MQIETLYSWNQWLFLGLIIVLFFLANEAGFRLGRLRHPSADDTTKSQVTTLQAAILALLGLLLGFTFSIAQSRFDVRKKMVLEESNAIGTAYLRAQLLPEPERNEIPKLLRQYVDVRLEGARTGNIQETIFKSEKLHDQLWIQAVAAGNKDSRALTTALFIQSLNDVIDLHSKRLRAIMDHVPEIVLLLLLAVAIFGMGMMGYGGGLGNVRHFIPTVAMAVLIAMVILVIIDLDQPGRGMIRVSQQSMTTLRDNINKPLP